MRASDVLHAMHEAVLVGELNPAVIEALVEDSTCVQECEVLDFKQQLPTSDLEYAKTCRDLLALHNSYGGFIAFGVREIERDRAFEIIGVEEAALNLAKLRDMMRGFTGVDIRIRSTALTVNDLHLEALWVPKRVLGDSPVKFVRNGAETKPGKLLFKKGDVVFRRIDNNAVAQSADDFDFLYSERRPPSLGLSLAPSAIGESLDNNLPDRTMICPKFVGRSEDIGDLWAWLADDFSRVRLIAGEGGLGKTSLAYRFAEEMATRRVKPFNKVVWLTAKRNQFIASRDNYRAADRVDFSDADSLFKSIAISHGCVEGDFDGLDTRGLMEIAFESCQLVPSFITVDDIDSLSHPDQLRALEFGMRMPQGTKMLLTTRVNFSYSPDNVLKLNGFRRDEFIDFVRVLRLRYELPEIKEGKVEQLRGVTGGSPLFADSLIRLERRGLSLDLAMSQWKGEKGMEARKAALQREVQQLSREAKRVLFTISQLKNCSYVELSQVVTYSEQTLGDALQELSGLFLISAPAIAQEARYTVEPNTGLLVLESAATLGIDHAYLVAATKRLKSDAIGLGLTKRSGIVGLAISQAIASLKEGGGKEALAVITSASKKLKPHPDLLLAAGRFILKIEPPNYSDASKAFEEAYELGQRKLLLFELWYQSELGRASFDGAIAVASKAIEDLGADQPQWYERRAEAYVRLAQRARARGSSDSAMREITAASEDYRNARRLTAGDLQLQRLDKLIAQADGMRREFRSESA